MFRAAPMGWGIGNSGVTYMKWFQTTDRSERYRTLVNSHLTWLVELGWGIGFIYLWGWFSLFWIAWKIMSLTDRGLSFGLIACLFTGGIFSSVLETVWLWILPILILGLSSVKMQWHGVQFGKIFSISAFAVLLAMCGFVSLSVLNGSTVRKLQDSVRCGNGDPVICLFPDSDVLGGELYMREFRDVLENHSGTVAVISDINNIPKNTDIIVLAGKQCIKINDILKSYTSVKLLLISPPIEFCGHLMGKIKEASCKVRVLIGEFSNALFEDANNNVIMVPGVNRYIPLRTEYIFDW
jgi:hypothetical protein